LGLFYDSPEFPYSIHNIALKGGELGTTVGNWVGPSLVCQAIRLITESLSGVNPSVNVHVAMDGLVCKRTLRNKIGKLHRSRVYVGAVKSCVESSQSRTSCFLLRLLGGRSGKRTESISLLKTTLEAISFPERGVGLILFVPLRLGVSRIEDAYIEQLKA
jgi:hypothetical protein